MQDIVLPDDRSAGLPMLLGSGSFRYRLDPQWAQWGEGMHCFPATDACCGPDDTLYVALEDPDCPIAVLDAQGRFLRGMGKGLFSKLHGISYTSRGTLLCADTGMDAHVVRELSLDGALIRDFGTLGQHCDNGYDIQQVKAMYADPSWEKSKRLAAALDMIQVAGRPFCRPTKMIQARSGMMYASDGYGNAAVQVFDPQGNYVQTWGRPGHGPGAFYLVHSICEDPLGRLWVADRENKRVQVFTPQGDLVAVISGGFLKVASFWCDGVYMYVGEQGGVSLLDTSFRLVGRFGDGGSLLRNNGMTGDSKGNLYICSHFRGPHGQGLLRLERV